MKDLAQYREWLDRLTSVGTLLTVNMFSENEGKKSYSLLLLLKSRVSWLLTGTALKLGMPLFTRSMCSSNNVDFRHLQWWDFSPSSSCSIMVQTSTERK